MMVSSAQERLPAAEGLLRHQASDCGEATPIVTRVKRGQDRLLKIVIRLHGPGPFDDMKCACSLSSDDAPNPPSANPPSSI